MSVSAIPARIFNFFKRAVTVVPFLAPTHAESIPDDINHNTYKVQINNFTQAKVNDENISFDLAPKIKSLMFQLESQNPNINDGTKDFQSIIGENIRPEIQEGVQKIKYNEKALEDSCKEFIDQREQDHISRITELNALQIKNKTHDLSQYDEVFQNFFQENLTLIHNLNNIIFQRITNTESFKSTDLDLAQGFKQTRNITATLCTKILNDFLMLLTKLPAMQEDDTKIYINQLKGNFQSEILTLLQGSHLGILDRDLVKVFLEHYLDKSEKQGLNNKDLIVLQEFQDGIHATSLLKENLDYPEIASLDLKITQRVIKDLNKTIIDLSNIRETNKEALELKQKLKLKIKDLSRYISATGAVEKRINECINSFSTDKSAIQLGIPREKILEIEDNYRKLYRIEGYIGRTKGDIINEEKFPEEALLNSFAGSKSAKDTHRSEFSRKYERLVLETSLVAGYHALAEKMDSLSDEQREKFFKDPIKFANFNKDHVPWLKGFYESELQRYRNIIKEDKSERKTTDLAMQMCNISQRLASPEIDYYQSNDIFKRYDLTNIAEAALKRIGTMTDVNRMYLALKVYSEIFSNIEKDSLKVKLTIPETKWLSRHIEFLKQLSLIKDKEGNPLYAPVDDNPYEQAKFDEINNYFSKPGTVNYNIDLILRYLRETISEKNNSSKKSEQKSDLDSRSLLMSSALMYYYLKFIPEESSNKEALSAKEKIIQLMFDNKLGTTRNLPHELGPKILDQFFGTESNEKGKPISAAKYERQGFLRSYALDLEKKLDTYIEGKEIKNFDLPSLLNYYYRLEEIKTKDIKDERLKHPEYAGIDISTIENDIKLNLWSRQEKVHIKFFNGRNKELLPPLKTKLKLLLEKHTDEVMKFISNLKDPKIKEELSKEVSKELFKKATKSADLILNYQSGNIIEINDLNKELLETTASTFANLSKIANLSYKGNLSCYALAENSILGEDNREEFTNNLKTIQNLLESRFLLVDGVNKTGEKVKGLKDIVINLLKTFKIRPQIGNQLQWLTENQINNYLDKTSLAQTRTYDDSSRNRVKSSVNLSTAA